MAKVQPELIHRLREMKGWSQSKLAQKAGIDAKTLSSVLNGKPYREDTISRIADALDVTPAELLEGSTPSPADARASTERHFQLQLVLSIPFEAVNTADGLSDLLRHISTLINAKGPISVVDVKAGSVILTLSLSEQDLRALILAAIVDDLEEIEFESLAVLDEGFEMPFNLPHVLDADSISKAHMETRKKATEARKTRAERKRKRAERKTKQADSENDPFDKIKKAAEAEARLRETLRKRSEGEDLDPKAKRKPNATGDS